MINLQTALLTLVFCNVTAIAIGQETSIKIPTDDDKYSKYVKQLEGSNINIDYTDFRNSFLDSKQFSRKGKNYDTLKKQVYAETKNKNYQAVVSLTQEMLSIDYTSMFAHKYLQQTYKILGDTVNQKKYHDIEFGLLYSITRSGDGKTCETGWHVTQIEEEYFILNMIGAQLQTQSTSSGGKNACDKMVVKTEGGEIKTYYFEANKVFEQERKLLEK
ncbi:DUF4919 domain-containing protein [Hymenobacter swuensis]|uniref:DUF4919 domain-containing protein n=1 Tax=Hymenobacter swuensis DY53 TaxID=1227739 RepID=W8EVW5_9BACT|nr:DUF4919 domain-containing protein [Hymenobacter swuensis]AHJ96673.1 hypothetical protein Hsw_1078 [Hymenobacter swuensis DY53]